MQKTAYEIRISDWSSDVCSSDLYSQLARRVRHLLRVDAVERFLRPGPALLLERADEVTHPARVDAEAEGVDAVVEPGCDDALGRFGDHRRPGDVLDVDGQGPACAGVGRRGAVVGGVTPRVAPESPEAGRGVT